jgi:hypothetical protein
MSEEHSPFLHQEYYEHQHSSRSEKTQPLQGRAGGKSFQGQTTVDPFEEARIAHQKACKEFSKGTTQAMLFVASPFLLLAAGGFVNYMLHKNKNLDKNEVSEPPRIEQVDNRCEANIMTIGDLKLRMANTELNQQVEFS